MPKDTSSAGKTPDSRSRIIQPSVRTVSLTQNGIRHITNSIERVRPRAILAIVHAIGNASSKVIAVASTDITAVRTKVCQYSGSSMKVWYWRRLGSYSPGATRARNDRIARSTCGNTTRPTSHSSAGAISSASSRRLCGIG